jgi:hypothetical protein
VVDLAVLLPSVRFKSITGSSGTTSLGGGTTVALTVTGLSTLLVIGGTVYCWTTSVSD